MNTLSLKEPQKVPNLVYVCLCVCTHPASLSPDSAQRWLWRWAQHTSPSGTRAAHQTHSRPSHTPETESPWTAYTPPGTHRREENTTSLSAMLLMMIKSYTVLIMRFSKHLFCSVLFWEEPIGMIDRCHSLLLPFPRRFKPSLPVLYTMHTISTLNQAFQWVNYWKHD